MVIGAILFVVGTAITLGTFASAKPGGTFIISWGPMVFGGIRLVTGMLTSARVKSELAAMPPRGGYAQAYATEPTPSVASKDYVFVPTPMPGSAPAPQAAPDVPAATSSPAGWHNDPSQRFQYRYWDGSTWTAHVQSNGVTAHDPV